MKDVVTPAAQIAGLSLASAFTMELVGVPLSSLMCALAGAVIGSGWAKPNGPMHATGLFFASALLSAVMGHAFSMHYLDGAAWATNVTSAVIAIAFHPGLRMAMLRFGAIFDAVLRRFGVTPAVPEPQQDQEVPK